MQQDDRTYPCWHCPGEGIFRMSSTDIHGNPIYPRKPGGRLWICLNPMCPGSKGRRDGGEGGVLKKAA